VDAAAGPFPAGAAATAPAIEAAPLEGPSMDEPRPPSGPPRQVPLFDDRPKIIPFETIDRRKKTPRRPPAMRRPALRGEQARKTGAQPPLDLRAAAPPERRAVNADARVAASALRLRAVLVDGVFVGAGLAGAATAFVLLGGSFDVPSKPFPWIITIAAVALFYHLFWCVLGRETAGQRSAGLRVLTFDLQRPDSRQFTLRYLMLCCGMVALGLGPLWALVDEEGLAWHDHISKTFPAEFDPAPSSARRR
jgi:uncharacterized RDD family membrane protein YckC